MIKYPFNPKPIGNNQFEQPCGVCGEIILIQPGDDIHIRTNNYGEIIAIFCVKCYKEIEKETEEQ